MYYSTMRRVAMDNCLPLSFCMGGVHEFFMRGLQKKGCKGRTHANNF